MSNLKFSINGKSLSPTLYKGESRQFSLSIDEPEALGGKDTAANPVEYLLAGYAGCLNVVLNLIAKEQNIVINELKINIEGDLNPEKFLGISDKARAGFQSINVYIDIDSTSSDTEIDELLRLTKERCPINDNLSNPTPINYFITTQTILN